MFENASFKRIFLLFFPNEKLKVNLWPVFSILITALKLKSTNKTQE